jgi:hypothetical protein
MSLENLKAIFEKLTSTVSVLKENKNNYNITQISDQYDAMCYDICDHDILQFKLTLGEYDTLKDLFEVLRFLVVCECETKTTIKDIKLLLINKIDMKTEILLRRFKNKSQIGTIEELPNDIIDHICNLETI